MEMEKSLAPSAGTIVRRRHEPPTEPKNLHPIDSIRKKTKEIPSIDK